MGPDSAARLLARCYMRGGTNPCVTDANIVLGKLNREKILGGRMDVDAGLAEKAIKENICDKSELTLDQAAAGIISVVNSNMTRAIRVVSVERGYDAREFTLMAFGGAGPLHACEVARDMGITSVLLPPSPGTLCSLGLLMADTKFDISRSNVMIAEEENLNRVQDIFDTLTREGNELLSREGVKEKDRSFTYLIECRYERQNYEIGIEVSGHFTREAMEEMIEKFHKEHNRSYGYFNRSMRIQMVNYRVSAVGDIVKPDLKEERIQENAPAPEPFDVRNVLFDREKDYISTNIYHREDFVPGCVIKGPAIIEQMDSTSVIPPGWKAYTDGYRNLRVTYEGGGK